MIEARVKNVAPAAKTESCRRERAEVRDVSRASGEDVLGVEVGAGAEVDGTGGSADMPERWKKAIEC